MGRGDSTNTAASSDASAWQNHEIAQADAATAGFNKKLGTLAAGGSIATNPFADPTYLRNQNIISSEASGAANDAGRAQILNQAQRTGENTAGGAATIRQLARDKMRTQTQYQAGRSADDYKNYLDWEKFILGSTLAPANVDTSLFSTATGQRNSADSNIASENNASMDMWGKIISSGLQGAGQVGAAAV